MQNLCFFIFGKGYISFYKKTTVLFIHLSDIWIEFLFFQYYIALNQSQNRREIYKQHLSEHFIIA